jgi:hypothetical protein
LQVHGENDEENQWTEWDALFSIPDEPVKIPRAGKIKCPPVDSEFAKAAH